MNRDFEILFTIQKYSNESKKTYFNVAIPIAIETT